MWVRTTTSPNDCSTMTVTRDFWTDVVVTSKDMDLTSARVRYLEARLVRLAKAIGRVPLENGDEPTGGADLPQADARSETWAGAAVRCPRH